MNSVATQAHGAKKRGWRQKYFRPLLLLLLVVLTAGGYLAYEQYFKPKPAATAPAQQVTVARGTITATVSSTGSVVPKTTSELSFATEGLITELNAGVGQTVKKGDVLARLETTDLNLAVLEAEANLASAESKLASLEAGSTAGDIATARAALKSAQASLDDLTAGPTPAEQQSAEAAVTSAKAGLAKAGADLVDLKAGPTETELTNAKISLEKAKIARHEAQGAYDKIAWKPGAEASAEGMALWQATTDYQAAEIAYEEAVAGATQEEVAVAEQSLQSAKAQLAEAEAALAELAAGPTDAELSTAEAAVVKAQTQLEETLNPTTAADLKAAQAAVSQAQVALENARSNLEKAAMLAPFDGVVAAVNGSVGQTASGTIVTLLDMSAPQLQITVTEADVAKLAAGQPATITFDSLSSASFSGKLLSISPKATVSSGVATYTAYVGIEQPATAAQGPGAGQSGAPAAAETATSQAKTAQATPAAGQRSRSGAGGAEQTAPVQSTVTISRLKAGMTGAVSITYLSKDSVLVVPNKAIKTQGQRRLVEVLTADGQTETRAVAVGSADDANTEITSGLQEGDTVLIAGTTTTTSTSSNTGNRNQQGGFQQGGIPSGMPPGGPGF